MAEVIRVVDGDRWIYVPADGAEQSRLERFAAIDMANVSNGSVFLKSDAGPLFWELLGKGADSKKSFIKSAADALGKECISLVPDEQLAFGNKKDATAYNKSVDISLVQREIAGPGLTIAARPIEEDEIVMTAWPKGGRFIPALAKVDNRRVWLELAEPQDEGERCFVLDEKCHSVITASFESDGSNYIQAMTPAAIDSWLCSVGSKAVMGQSRRYALQADGIDFIIKDRKTGRSYKGQFSQKDGHQLDFEKMRMERLLASKGLGAILPSYILNKA